MRLIADSFWRAATDCLRPRVVLLSLLPLVLMVVVTALLGYFFWESAMAWVRDGLDALAFTQVLWQWLEGVGMGAFKVVLAPLLVIFAVTPLIVVAVLLAVALLIAPALVALVARLRFPQLQAKQGASLLRSVVWSLGSALAALAALVVSMPLWAVPPLILVLPPLIWGWLTYRVMAFDALSQHASDTERRLILRRHRLALLAMGVGCGYLGAAPSVVWASTLLFAAAFPLLLPVAVWIYTLVFIFSALWFSHYCLAALQALRAQTEDAGGAGVVLDAAVVPQISEGTS
jgi:hypothetical protein